MNLVPIHFRYRADSEYVLCVG